jgi:hypothetical protein
MNVSTLIGCPVGINHVPSYHTTLPAQHTPLPVISFTTSPLRQGKGVFIVSYHSSFCNLLSN